MYPWKIDFKSIIIKCVIDAVIQSNRIENTGNPITGLICGKIDLNSDFFINELLLLAFSLEVCTEKKSMLFNAFGRQAHWKERD